VGIDELEAPDQWPSGHPPTARQRWFAAITTAVFLLAFGALVPFAGTPLATLNAFFPSIDGIVFVTDLVTAVLLFAQFSVSRSRAFLALASGYLFTALIVIPHALTFSGAFSPTGLLGAGIQTGSWIFIFWHIGFSAGLLAYAVFRGEAPPTPARAGPTLWAIICSVASSIALVCGLTWLTTAGVTLLPPIILDQTHISPIVIYPVWFTILISASALAVLLVRRRSVFDQWLMLVALASILEMVFSGLLPAVRFSLGFYAGRMLSVILSSILLIVLLAETTRLYARLARDRLTLERTSRDLAKAKRAAEAANRAKSEFLAGMSHEIRTPITCTIGVADLLEGSQLTAQQRGHVALLKDASESLLAIVDDLLDISKIEAGKLELDRDAVSVAATAEAAIAIVEQHARAKGLALRCELATDIPTSIEGDATRLRQVLLNLLSNAIKFTKRGSVVLRVMRAANAETARLRFEVEDTGIGIDPAQRHLLFQRFSQLGDSTHRRFGGVGLGLAISRNLVEMMGGTIGVDSRVGDGSTFWFTIPYVETKPHAAATRREAAADAASRARVLVAEDNAMIRQLIEAMLTDAGHEVVLVRDGIEAIDAVQASDFDVVLMDIQMPELDGITATRWIRAMSDRVRNIPIIALTAYAMPEDIELCLAAGANAHLSKPIDRNELLQLAAKWSGSGRTISVATPNVVAEPQVLDLAMLDDLEKRFGAARAAVFSGQFRDHVGKALEVITATIDRRRIAEEAHNLISTAGALGCEELVALSRALMDAAERETGDLRPHVARLTAATTRALAAVQAHMAGTRQPSTKRTG
jgi:two-component system, sensor histidine kinase and response regulator